MGFPWRIEGENDADHGCWPAIYQGLLQEMEQSDTKDAYMMSKGDIDITLSSA